MLELTIIKEVKKLRSKKQMLDNNLTKTRFSLKELKMLPEIIKIEETTIDLNKIAIRIMKANSKVEKKDKETETTTQDKVAKDKSQDLKDREISKEMNSIEDSNITKKLKKRERLEVKIKQIHMVIKIHQIRNRLV